MKLKSGTNSMGGVSASMFDDWKKSNSGRFAPALIGPHSEYAAERIIISNTAIESPIGAMGIAKYEDIFGYPHLSEFCFNIKPPTIDLAKYPIGQAVYLGGFPCDSHNCIDAECGPDWKRRAKQ
jgi:hypothetical protein